MMLSFFPGGLLIIFIFIFLSFFWINYCARRGELMPSPRDRRTRTPELPYSSYLDAPILQQEVKYLVLMLYTFTLYVMCALLRMSCNSHC